jgi:arabinofuranan 3-O-arabinosyltransferase
VNRAFGTRLGAACVLLCGLAFVQDPGFLIADTKFDLAVAPADFLARALHLWDEQAAFGQLQNQAYGYLWPMGPFFLLGALLDAPGWVVQRLWIALVMSVAFVGSAKVSRALGVRSDAACLMAGFAFALSPRMMTELGPISIEAWPSALTPWVLLPLITGSTQGSPRRAAALSALAVAMVGGVNAAATFAVLPLGVVWLLTRTPGPRRRSLMWWWPCFTALGTAWWLVPLFLMGAYSPPFLDFIETTSVTTFPTTLFDALRGTSNWVPYIDSRARAGNDLVTTSYLVLNSGVLLLLGFAGLADRRNPHRAFLALSVLLGVVMVTAGHRGSVEGWFAQDVRGLLDGVLAPLRNVHKFDPVIRLPLVVGLAAAVDRIWSPPPVRSEPVARDGPHPALVRLNRVTFQAAALLALAGAALPAATGRLAPAGALPAVPDYWTQAAQWLEDESGGGTALLVPGAPFADYLWGSPRDEPLQWLAGSRWATRNVIPLTPPGNIRMLDAIEDRLVQGHGSAGLTRYLERAGVEHLVVRNDLRRSDDVPDPVFVHQAIAESPGLSRVASFGPDVGGGAHLDGDAGRVVINGGWQSTYPAVEIFAVESEYGAQASGVPDVVAGGPEDLVDLADLGVVESAPVVLASDAPSSLFDDPGATARLVLTDGLRAREHFFARIHDGTSAVLTPGDVRRSGNPSRDYLAEGQDRWSTRARLNGALRLSASSSQSDADSIGGSRRGTLPFAAVDGSTATQWLSGSSRAEQAWWEVELESPRAIPSVTLTGGVDAAVNQTVRVSVGDTESDPLELGPGDVREIGLTGGATGSVVRVEEASGSGRPLALAEVEIDGVRVTRDLVLPTLPDSWGVPDVIVMRAERDWRTGCVVVGVKPRCVVGKARESEEPVGLARVVALPAAKSYIADLRLLPRAGAALDALVMRDQPINISASSVGVPDPRASPVSAIDGRRRTSWMAEVGDLRPTLSLNWLGRHRVSGLSVALSPNTAGRAPTRVSLIWPDGRREVELVDGRARFAPIVTDQLQLRVEGAERAVNLGYDAQTSEMPVAIGELRLRGVPYLPLGLSADPSTLPCGTGPAVVANGQTWATAASASPAALHAGAPLQGRLCSGPSSQVSIPLPPDDETIELVAGENRLVVADSDALSVVSLVLRALPAATISGPAASAETEAPDAVSRSILPSQGDVVVGLGENQNPGWEATQGGLALQALVLDGWQQSWLLRSDDAPVDAVFSPDLAYRIGLAVGLVCLLGLAAYTVSSRRAKIGPFPAPLAPRAVPGAVLLLSLAAGGGLVAGWSGVLAALLGASACLPLTRWVPGVTPWLLGVPCLVVAAAYAVTPWGSSSGWAGEASWPVYLMLVPVSGALALAMEPRGDSWILKRRAGRSTTR